jgi:hypothetical protein
MFCFENYLGSSSLLVKMTEITEKAQTTAPAARTGCLTLGTPFPNGRQLGTYPPWPNSRLLVHMVFNACSASEVTSLGSRFYVHLPMNRSESVNECIGLIWSDRVNTARSVGLFLSLSLLLFFPEDRASSSRSSCERRLISLIFAGRNRIIMIRRELPLTVIASLVEPVA